MDFDSRRIQILENVEGLSIWIKVDNIVFGGIYVPPARSPALSQGYLEHQCPVTGMLVDFEDDEEDEEIVLDKLTEKLLRLPSEFEEYDNLFLLGDLNARFGNRTGDHGGVTGRASVIYNKLLEKGLHLAMTSFGEPSFVTSRGSSIVDHVFLQKQCAHHEITEKVVYEV